VWIAGVQPVGNRAGGVDVVQADEVTSQRARTLATTIADVNLTHNKKIYGHNDRNNVRRGHFHPVHGALSVLAVLGLDLEMVPNFILLRQHIILQL